jgi:hypothetical protein
MGKEAATRNSAFRRPLLLVVLSWGALWGAALGAWLMAPRLLESQHVETTLGPPWIVLVLAVATGSALLGMLCSLAAGTVVATWQLLRRRPYRDASWAFGLGVGALLPAAYAAFGTFLERQAFGEVASLQDYVGALPLATVAYGGALLAIGLVYDRLARRPARPSTRSLAFILVATLVLGFAVLPLRVEGTRRARHPVSGDLVPAPGATRPGAPLLLIGFDGGNWETISPLLKRGELPTIARLLASGMHGDMNALWYPYWSSPAWAAILTGRSREENGVYGDIVLEARGLPHVEGPTQVDLLLAPAFLVEWALIGMDVVRVRHPPRSALRGTPLWELLSRAGIETAVLRFAFTYPARDETKFMVSDWAGRDTWQLANLRPSHRPEIANTAARDAGLLEFYSDAVPVDLELLAEVLPRYDRPAPADAIENPLDVLRIALDLDRRTLTASQRLLEIRPNLPALALYLSGFDKICHAFWQYRFPGDYGDRTPSAEDVTELGPVVDRYLAFFDRRLGQLLAQYSTPPNVVIVSDHGFVASSTHPLWRGWHGPRGIFIAAGPGFPHRAESISVSYYDVVPTVADVMGFVPPAELPGSSLLRR